MPKYIKSLTSLRGIAALIIVIHHFSYYGLPQLGATISSYSDFFSNGYLCVDFFFILSGFIMAHVYVNQFASGISLDNYRSYIFSRFARIYPLHFLMILLFMGVEFVKIFLPNTSAFTGKFNLTALFANIFMLQAFDLNCPPLFRCDTYWNEPAWSISVEFVIYCIFPIFLFLIFKSQPKWDVKIYFLTFMSILPLIIFYAGNLNSIIGIPSIARCGLECILGIITYKIYDQGIFHKYFNQNFIAAISLIWIVLIMQYNWSDSVGTVRSIHDWISLPAFSLLILSLSSNTKGLIAKILNSSSILYLGAISYSIYMVHWFIQELLKLLWFYKFNVNFGSDFNEYQSLISLSLFMFVILLSASIIYRLIEMPIRSYLKDINLVKKHIYHQ